MFDYSPPPPPPPALHAGAITGPFVLAAGRPRAHRTCSSGTPGRPGHRARSRQDAPLHFVVVTGEIKQVLTGDVRRTPHQRFLLSTHLGGRPRTLEVINDVGRGRRVPALDVGKTVTIRGVMFHDRRHDGIHWTHHRARSDDAGFIQTHDGSRYQ